MESSNSGSLQSSSGNAGADNEEYDSRTQSISSFLNPSTHFNHHLRPPSTDTTFFDPSSVSSFSNPVHDLGSVWSRNFRPDPNVADFGSTTYPNPSRMEANTNTNTKTGRGSDHHHHVGVTAKNPKKRTRASRRAPTTVLTTDTTNFRQMVQEFTGIPPAPFSGDAFSRRLGHAGDAGIGPLFPLRPSVQKIQPQQPSFLNSTTADTSSNYQLPPSGIHEFQKHPSGFLDLQNPLLSFQSLLQTTIPQQINDNSNTKSNHLSGFPSSSKRWRCQDGKSESNTENIGDYKLNSGLENVVVSSGDQIEGNEDSWICPSS